MPLSKKDKEFLKKLIRQYGLKKGKSVFYAMEKVRKAKGVKKNKNTKGKYKEFSLHTKLSLLGRYC